MGRRLSIKEMNMVKHDEEVRAAVMAGVVLRMLHI